MPDLMDDAYNPVHQWARCYACPGCLTPYATDEAAMRVIRPIVAAAERLRMTHSMNKPALDQLEAVPHGTFLRETS
jgi:hypothetical protein